MRERLVPPLAALLAAILVAGGCAAAEIEDPGFKLFLSTGCSACHRIAGTPAAGEIGPDLTNLAARATIGANLLAMEPREPDRLDQPDAGVEARRAHARFRHAAGRGDGADRRLSDDAQVSGREHAFGGTAFANVMHFAATGLTDRQIGALAAWYSSLPWRAAAAPS